MTLNDQITADQAAITDAQAQLDAANAKLATDQAALDAVAPHLSVLGEIEAEAAKYGSEAMAAITAGCNKLRSLFGVAEKAVEAAVDPAPAGDTITAQ